MLLLIRLIRHALYSSNEGSDKSIVLVLVMKLAYSSGIGIENVQMIPGLMH